MAPKLGEFDNKPVRRTSLIIRGTGDGLSKAMRTEPQLIHAGEKRYVLMEIIGDKIRHDLMDDGDAWDRVHMTVAQTCALVDEEFARDAIDAQAEKNLKLEEEAKGLVQLSPGAARLVEHDQGLHKRRRKDCPGCYPDLGEEESDGVTPIGRAKGASKRARQS